MREIAPDTVASQLRDGRIVLVDVREPHEYAEARIEGALNFPLSTFAPQALPAGGDREVVLHCGTAKRSASALQRCADAGVGVDAHMQGGLSAWREAGLPVVSVDPSTGELVRSQGDS